MDLKKHESTIALILAFGLIFSYSIEPVRVGVGSAMDVVFGPLAAAFPFSIVILILAVITGLYSSLIQKYTIDYERMQEIQKRFKEFQKEFREAQLSEDEKRIKKLEAKRDRMMAEQMEMTRQQFTPMSYILLVSVPIFFWLLFRIPLLDSGVDFIVFPFVGQVGFSDPALGPVPAWILWYMICSLSISQVIRKSLNIGGI